MGRFSESGSVGKVTEEEVLNRIEVALRVVRWALNGYTGCTVPVTFVVCPSMFHPSYSLGRRKVAVNKCALRLNFLMDGCV